MRLDSFVKAMMATYPSLFPTRERALDQLFLVNGNGLEWQDDGTLAHDFPDEDTDALARRIEAGEVDDADLVVLRELELVDSANRMAADMKKSYDKMRAQAKAEGSEACWEPVEPSETAAYWLAKEKADIAESHERASRGWFDPYPICEYAKCSNVPDNVAQDYLEGCLHILDFVGKLEPVCQSKYLGQVTQEQLDARKAETIAEAKRLAAELRQRFASRLP